MVPKHFKNIFYLVHALSTLHLVCCLQNCNKLLEKRISPDQEHDFKPALALKTVTLTWRESSRNGKSRVTSINTAQLESTSHKPNKQSKLSKKTGEHKEMENERPPSAGMPYKLLCNALDLKIACFQLTVQLPEKCYSIGINGYTWHVLTVYIKFSNKN